MIRRYITLEELVKRFFPELYLRLLDGVGQLKLLNPGFVPDPRETIQTITQAGLNFGESIALVREDCVRLDLVVSLVAVDEFINLNERLMAHQANWDTWNFAVNHLAQTLRNEMEGKVFMHLEPNRVPLAFELHHFGEHTDIAFPLARWDIKEASRCLAFDRGTAAVFHLMRIMEVGLRILGATLHIPTSSNRSWESILQKCDAEIAKPFKEKSPKWQADEVFLAGATARLRAVKDAWRNPTMHVEAKYTQEQAEGIYGHVQDFMRHLATKLKE